MDAFGSTSDEVKASPDSEKRLQILRREPTVTIYIGSDRIPYYIHRSLACTTSPFIAAALKEAWTKESQEYHFATFSEDDFDVAVYWMYRQELPEHLQYRHREKIRTLTGDENLGNELSYRLAAAYKMADALMMNDLQNAIIDEKFNDMREHRVFWKWNGIKGLADRDVCHTKYWDLALKSFVEMLARNSLRQSEDSTLETDSADYPMVAQEILVHLLRYHRNDWKHLKDCRNCDFHVHSDGKRCDELQAI